MLAYIAQARDTWILRHFRAAARVNRSVTARHIYGDQVDLAHCTKAAQDPRTPLSPANGSPLCRLPHVSKVTSHYQGRGWPSRKNPPVGPSSGRSAAHTTLAAPSATGLPPTLPMSVATQPGQTLLTRMPAPRSSAASMRVKALSATFDVL